MTGVIACVAVLVVASVFGVVWKSRNGRIRPVTAVAVPDDSAAAVSGSSLAAVPDGSTTDSAVPGMAVPGSPLASAVPGTPLASAVPGDATATSSGPAAPDHAPAGAGLPAGTLTETELGRPLGSRATLVQFSTAFCAPCRATRVILADVAGRVDGVTHVEIDAESHLDLVRRLDIRRTPTVLVLGPDGRIAQRGSGQPRKADVLAVIGGM